MDMTRKMEKKTDARILSPEELVDIDGGRRRKNRSSSRKKKGTSSRSGKNKKRSTTTLSGSAGKTAASTSSKRRSSSLSTSRSRSTSSRSKKKRRSSGKTTSTTRYAQRPRRGSSGLYRDGIVDQTGFEQRYGFSGQSSCYTVSILNLYRDAPGGFSRSEVDRFVKRSVSSGAIDGTDGSLRALDSASIAAAVESGNDSWYGGLYDRHGELITLSVHEYATGVLRGNNDLDGAILRLENDKTDTVHYVTGYFRGSTLRYIDPLDPTRTYSGTNDRIASDYQVTAVIPLRERRL